MPSVPASLPSLCLDGLEHSMELPEAWISAAVKPFLWFTTFKCFVRFGKRVGSIPLFPLQVCLRLHSRTGHGLTSSLLLLSCTTGLCGHRPHNPGHLLLDTTNTKPLPGWSSYSLTPIPALPRGFTWESAWRCCQTQLFPLLASSSISLFVYKTPLCLSHSLAVCHLLS